MGSEGLKAACLLMGGAVSCPVSFLAQGVPELVPTGCCVGPGLGTNKLEGGFQNGACHTSVHMVGKSPLNGCHQGPCPQGELQLPPASLGDSPRSGCRSNPGSFQIIASSLGSGICGILCAPFNSGVYFL